MSVKEGGEQATTPTPIGRGTVEAAVRAQLSGALGGRRGIVEAALPTITFTLGYVTTKSITVAIAASVAVATAMLVARLVQRSSVQFVLNAFFGIGVGCFFVWLGARNGGDESRQALAYFAPGLIYNAGYAVLMAMSIVVRWPVVGFMVGAMAEDPLGWRQDRQVVRLCSRLTAVLLVPCLLRVAVQGPIYLAGRSADDADAWITALGVSKVVMGWPLQLAALGAMVWLLTRDRTPLEEPERVQDDVPTRGAVAPGPVSEG